MVFPRHKWFSIAQTIDSDLVGPLANPSKMALSRSIHSFTCTHIHTQKEKNPLLLKTHHSRFPKAFNQKSRQKMSPSHQSTSIQNFGPLDFIFYGIVTSHAHQKSQKCFASIRKKSSHSSVILLVFFFFSNHAPGLPSNAEPGV